MKNAFENIPFDAINKLLEKNLRICCAVAFASAMALFFPETWVPFSIDDFREAHGIWLFLVFTLFSALSLSYLIAGTFRHCMKLYRKWREKVRADKTKRANISLITNLSASEKNFLHEFVLQNSETIEFVISSKESMVGTQLEIKKLVSKQLGNRLYGTVYMFEIVPWAYELIIMNKELISTEEGNQDE